MEKQETIADIIAEMRALSNSTSDGIIAINGRIVADRIGAAWKREKAAIEVDALAVGGMVEASRATAEKSSVVGDTAKLREALKKVAESSAEIMERVRYKDGLAFNTANYIADVARTALAEPVRNCEVGTAEEQAQRFKFAKCDKLPKCRPWGECCLTCFAKWAQMPYKEGDAE